MAHAAKFVKNLAKAVKNQSISMQQACKRIEIDPFVTSFSAIGFIAHRNL